MNRELVKVAFAPNPKAAFDRLVKQMPGGGPVWKNIECVDNMDDADLFVVFDRLPAHVESKVPRDRIIYMRREPPHIFQDFKINTENYFATFNYPSFTDEYNPVTWWLGETYDELKSEAYSEKGKPVSAVVTNKWRKRAEFIKMLASNVSDLEVWGRWIYSNSDGDFIDSDAYKGKLNGDSGCTSKREGIAPYQYSVCIENCSRDSYWTEKIVDSILCWTVPIYFGAPNIHKFFPEEAVHQIDLRKASVAEIREIASKPPTPIQIEALAEARNLILDKYNMWSVLDDLING